MSSRRPNSLRIRKKKGKLAGHQTDSEMAERHWASLNTVPSNAREMGPGARRDALDDGARGTTAEGRRMPKLWTDAEAREFLDKQLSAGARSEEEWADAPAIAAWDAAFESLRDFFHVDTPMQRYAGPGYVEIDDDVAEREWVETKPGDPEPFPMSWKEYRRILERMPKSGGSKKKLPKVKLFAAPVEMEVKMEEID
ncbi:hypothetical protein B0H13DRAFT_2343585 [Mycena leptocephala]|nr:hypothetical protein B0H13DRAFT_2343585 [Mycena leptocephala]